MLLFNRNMQRSHRSSSHACKHSNTKGVNVIICLERAVASGFAVLVYTIAVDNSSDVARDEGEAEESGGLNVLVDAVYRYSTFPEVGVQFPALIAHATVETSARIKEIHYIHQMDHF